MFFPEEVAPAINDSASSLSPNSPKSLTALDSIDGKNFGTAMTSKIAKEPLEQRVTRVVGNSKALKQLLPHLFPHFESMMIHILQNKIVDMGETRQRAKAAIGKIKSGIVGFSATLGISTTTNSKVDIAPAIMGPTGNENENTSKSEAVKIGKSFAMFLLTTTEPSAAVDAWTKDNKELKDLMETDWFEPMMNAIAKGLLKSSNLGLKWRVGLGAGLSIMDMITDTGVINSYRASGNTKGAYSLMAMIGSNMAVQLLFTYAQNKKKSKWVILREFAFVVTFLKPGVDAFRVATGHEDEEAVTSPLMEMALGKGTELAFESIPGGLLQAYFFINSPNKTLFLLISILISTLTTGFASALISFDMDISVANRKEVPLFYGYIKDSNTERMITFILQVSERELSGGGVVNRAKLTFDSLGADSARQLPQPQPHNRHRSAVLSEQEANVRRDPCRNVFVPSLQGGEERLRALGSRP